MRCRGLRGPSPLWVNWTDRGTSNWMKGSPFDKMTFLIWKEAEVLKTNLREREDVSRRGSTTYIENRKKRAMMTAEGKL